MHRFLSKPFIVYLHIRINLFCIIFVRKRAIAIGRNRNGWSGRARAHGASLFPPCSGSGMRDTATEDCGGENAPARVPKQRCAAFGAREALQTTHAKRDTAPCRVRTSAWSADPASRPSRTVSRLLFRSLSSAHQVSRRNLVHYTRDFGFAKTSRALTVSTSILPNNNIIICIYILIISIRDSFLNFGIANYCWNLRVVFHV